MGEIVEEIELPALRELRNVDCPTSRCYANAYGTGRLLHIVYPTRDHWYVEFCCPDCGDPHTIGTKRVDALGKAIRKARASERDAIARAWVAQCPSTHPCR